MEHNGEKITMLAMGIPLKNGKHVIAYYEFSKPVQGVKTRAFLWSVEDKTVKTEAVTTNGIVTPTSTCRQECSGNSDCGEWQVCDEYCCYYHFTIDCLAECCGLAGVSCFITCSGNPLCIAACVAVGCPLCMGLSSACCEEIGHQCVDMGDMP